MAHSALMRCSSSLHIRQTAMVTGAMNAIRASGGKLGGVPLFEDKDLSSMDPVFPFVIGDSDVGNEMVGVRIACFFLTLLKICRTLAMWCAPLPTTAPSMRLAASSSPISTPPSPLRPVSSVAQMRAAVSSFLSAEINSPSLPDYSFIESEGGWDFKPEHLRDFQGKPYPKSKWEANKKASAEAMAAFMGKVAEAMSADAGKDEL